MDYPSGGLVESSDDLLREILFRLPVTSLVLFKHVSKRWSSLISDAISTMQTPNLYPPCGLFLMQLTSTFKYYLVPLDARNNPVHFTNFPFASNGKGVEILHSCNGLFLCRSKGNIYVYNPFMNLFRKLPTQLNGALSYPNYGHVIVFDPTKSPHYKVFVYDYAFIYRCYANCYATQIHIYSSDKGYWNVYDVKHSVTSFSGFNHGIYWNDGIHWLATENGRQLLVTLDVTSLVLTSIQTPDASTDCKLFESRGCLLLAALIHPQRLNIYEMSIAGIWSVKYNVNLDGDMSNAGLGMRRSYLYYLRAIVVGERENDALLVMEIDGKVVQYNIMLKTLHHVYELGSNVRTGEFDTFQFNVSSAQV